MTSSGRRSRRAAPRSVSSSGSTRIKAVLIGPDQQPIAAGSHAWENAYVDRSWTYSLEAVWAGLQDCYAKLADDVRQRYGVELTTVGALGVSAMMHGYLAFDAAGDLLTPFRTWRNTNTGPATEVLSAAFGHNIPHRWSVAHLYQAILDGEEHLARIAQLTTLAGYVHGQLTGEQVLGVGDASGMFPIDIATGGYDAAMLDRVRRSGRGRRDRPEAGRPAARRSGRRRTGRPTHRRGATAARPHRPAAARGPDVPTRRRRRNRHGRHQLRRTAHRQRQRRHQHLRHGRARTGTPPSPPRTGPRHHPGRRPRRHGALQQRGQRTQRLGRPVRRVRRRRSAPTRTARRCSRLCSPRPWTGRPTAAA